MNESLARHIVSYSWTRGREHPQLTGALDKLGLTRNEFNRLHKEMRRVTSGRRRAHVLTPSGCGVRV